MNVLQAQVYLLITKHKELDIARVYVVTARI
jgi:hypothetical protein